MELVALYLDYNILKKMNEYASVWDEKTMTQYAYSSSGMVSYDDKRAICDKTKYAQVHGLNRYIIWELSGGLNVNFVHRYLTQPITSFSTWTWIVSALISLIILTW